MKNSVFDFEKEFKRPSFEAYFEARRSKKVTSPGAHFHHGWELLYLYEGESHIVVNGKLYKAFPGCLAVYHPGVVHEEYVQPGMWRIICLRFPSDIIRLPLPNENLLPPVIRLSRRSQFRSIFEKIVEENARVDQWSRFLIGTYLAHFTVLLWRALAEVRSDINDTSNLARARINQIIKVVGAGLRHDITLSELASKAFLSESRFSHVFKEVTGEPPRKYLIRRNIEQAKDLLAGTDDSIAEISVRTGYNNPRYFFRLFKKLTGQTPGQFRQISRKVHT